MKRLAYICLGVVFALILIIFFLPSIISTSWGTRTLISLFTYDKQEHIHIDELNICWLGPQVIQGLTFTQPPKGLSFHANTLSSSAELWNVLFPKKNLKEVLISSPTLQLHSPGDSLSNLTPNTPPPTLPVSLITSTPTLALASPTLLQKLPTTFSLKGTFTIANGTAEISLPGNTSVLLSSLEAHVHMPTYTLPQTIVFTCKTTQNKTAGHTSFEAQVDEQNALSFKTQTLHFPVDGVDQLIALYHPPAKGLLLEGLGSTIDLDLRGRLSKQTFELACHLTSPKLLVDIQTKKETDAIVLSAPASLSLQLTPPFFHLFSRIFDVSAFTLTNSVDLLLKIPSLKIPIKEHNIAYGSAQMEGVLTLTPATLSSPLLKTPLTIKNFSCNLSSNTLQKTIEIATRATIESQNRSEKLELLSTVQRDVEKDTYVLNSTLTTPSFKVSNLRLALGPDLVLTDPATFFYSPSQGQGPRLPFDFKAKEPIAITFDTLVVPHPFDFKNLKADGTLALNELELNLAQVKSALYVGDIQGHFSVNTPDNISLDLENPTLKTHLALSGAAKQEVSALEVTTMLFEEGKTAGTINADLRYTPQGLEKGGLQIREFSTTLLDHFLRKASAISPLFGPTLNLTLEMTPKKGGDEFHLAGESQNFSGNASFLSGEEGLSLVGGNAKITWDITPEGFALLDTLHKKESPEPPLYTLENTASCHIEISKLEIPRTLSGAVLQGEIQLNSLKVHDVKNGTTVVLKHFNGEFEKSKPDAPLHFRLQGAAAPEGELLITGNLHNLFDQEGKLSLFGMSANLSAELRQFPSPLVDFFAKSLIPIPTHLPLSVFTGETVNAQIKAEIEKSSGAFDLSIHSRLAKASASGKLLNGTLTLTTPLHAQLTVTKDVSKAILKKGNPLSISSLASDHPITLEVSSQGFTVPLKPFETSKVNIPKMRLELGLVTSKPKGALKNILKLLKSSASSNADLTLWFTPIDMHLVEGVLDIERTEVFINNEYEIALWGKINYPKNTVKMTLGLTEQALKNAFGITKLPQNYVLHIPLEGTPDDVHLDKVSATAKIASLLAWQHASGEGSGGGLFGDVIGAIATLPDKDANTPPPKKPFPWAQKKTKPQKTAHLQKRKPYSNPLKELVKVVR